MSGVVWQSISSSRLPGSYSNDISFPVSQSYTKFTNNDAHRSSSAIDNFNMRIISTNGTVRIEKSSIPITVVEKAKENTKNTEDSRGGRLYFFMFIWIDCNGFFFYILGKESMVGK